MKRRIKRIIITAFVVAVLGAFDHTEVNAASGPVSICSKEEWEVLKIVNKERMNKGLNSLSTYKGAQAAGQLRAKELEKLFDHTRPNGSSCFTVKDEVGIGEYSALGENIAAGQNSAKVVMNSWMNSPGHKANILGERFTHVGIGYSHNSSVAYKHYWTQFFIGSCEAVSISVKDANTTKSYKSGTAIDDMGRVLEVKCLHGTSYMPIITNMCSGYNKNKVGTQTITVKCNGLKTTFKVKLTGVSIKSASVSNIKNKVYTGKSIKQTPKVVLKNKTLKKDIDYMVTYKNNKNAGKATIIINGTGKYSGTIKKTFTIKKRPIKTVKMNKFKNQTYTGKRIKPKVTLKYDGKTLNKENYSVKYSNNIKTGKAKVEIKGKNNLSGSRTESFKIVK